MVLRIQHFLRIRQVVLPKRTCGCQQISFCTDGKKPDNTEFPKRFKIFQDEDSPVILDVGEEQQLYKDKLEIQKIAREEEENVVYTRGVTGVFDVEELVELIKKDNAKNVFVVKVPAELKYVDYLVIATGYSRRHLIGLAEYVRGIYKRKKDPGDPTPRIEGENSSEWVALDLGNIALHIMSPTARQRYDLESLWSVGAKYDVQLLKEEEDEVVQLLKKHSVTLDDLHPLRG